MALYTLHLVLAWSTRLVAQIHTSYRVIMADLMLLTSQEQKVEEMVCGTLIHYPRFKIFEM